MENILTLHNDVLTAEIRLPDSDPMSERFDSAAVVRQVVLHGRHRFGQPEQRIPERVTCWGFGLCAEYDMNAIGEEARVGEAYPKPGVGLMTQIEDGLPYVMWRHYEIQRFPKTWEHGEDWITFHETPIPCRGVALEITRALRLQDNRIVLTTTVRNAGERAVDFSEYQHNFVAIDDLPVGEGYCLELPFDGTIGKLPGRCLSLQGGGPADPFICTEGQRAYWLGKIENKTWHKVTAQEDILPCDTYSWTLSHASSDASVSETCGFVPTQLVLWGVEHVISTEVYHGIRLAPGETDAYVRTWTFSDSETLKQ